MINNSDGTSETAEAWNNHRREILGLALRTFLFPLFSRELRAKLSQDAQDFVAHACAKKLEAQLLVAPWSPSSEGRERDEEDEEDQDEKRPNSMRVMATCRGGVGEPTMAAILDEEGAVLEVLKLSFMNERYFKIH